MLTDLRKPAAGEPPAVRPRVASHALVLDGYLKRRGLDLPTGPPRHLHGDFAYAQTNFIGDPHGAVECVSSAPLLEQVPAVQGRGVRCL